MADTVSVTQADRALFFDLFEISEGNRERVMRGDEDKRPQMQRIAAFRLASTQPAPAFPREEVAGALEAIIDEYDDATNYDMLTAGLEAAVEKGRAALLQGKQP